MVPALSILLFAGVGLVAVQIISNSPEPVPSYVAQPGRDTCQGAEGYAASFGGRRTFLWRSDWLKEARHDLMADEAAYQSLLQRADLALTRGPYSVVHKTGVPAGGSRADYMSLGSYWWPDESGPEGAPYIRKDGHANPERTTDRYDLQRLEAFSLDTQNLALAYYFSDDPRYAKHAAKLIKAWFITPDTRMNPNLRFAQGIPGRAEGRSYGIIDTLRLLGVVESIGLLAPSPEISPAELAALKQWFRDYTGWLKTHVNGQDAGKAKNNHGSWYDTQLMSFALFAGDLETAREVAEEAGERRIATQIAPNGTMPHEIERTRSLLYSIYATQALTAVATLGECVGLDLWHYAGPDNQTIRTSVDFLAAFAGREAEWPYAEMQVEHERFYELLATSAWAYDDSHLKDAAKLMWERASSQPIAMRLYPHRSKQLAGEVQTVTGSAGGLE
ncbi:alginate lyase [Agaricicola taiwanensis]|uniref:Alginate lyase n=2 Tax=Agaricicola taiwanensis TaxID=591372 RepID=A0A8J2YN68_9RHOB|nr:alginate lyase [Agaricicola taiwanensis]